ncbi:SNF2 family N-terminal domain-containing protein [Trichoderma pleuroticola]
MESPVTAGPASPAAATLPTPAESPKSNHAPPEKHDFSNLVDALEKSDDCNLASAEQDVPSSSTDSTILAESMGEESLFVEDDDMAIDGTSSHVHKDKVDGTDDDLPSLEKFLCDEVDERDDDDSDYKNDGDDFDDESDKEHLSAGEDNDSIQKKRSRKPRQKPATNVREYVARLHAKEDEQFAKKMEREECRKPGAKPPRKRRVAEGDAESCKALKTANGHRLLLPGDDCSQSSDDSPLLPIEPIKASTHAEQFAQITASIPQNCDTRRKGTQKRDLKEAAQIFGYRKVEAQNGDWKLKGMATAMRNHQLTAVAWMMKRELARSEPHGGILADAMGMGKTVMSLACMVGNPPDDKDCEKFCNATLVVVPNKTIAQQWESETRKHCLQPYKHMVFIYDPRREDLREICRENFIVIVTYKEVFSQYPSDDFLRKLLGKYDSDDDSFRIALDKILGNVFRINWYRIILDEAHAIKNADSRTSKACCALVGKYRWALSGTPLANSSQEMYPYMKFLKCEWTFSRKEFRSMFFGAEDEPNPQFVALTSLMMYRRTVDDAFLGRQIVSLPERKEVDIWVALSKEEQAVVDAVCKHYRLRQKRKNLSKLGLGLDEVGPEERDPGERQSLKNGIGKPKPKKSSAHGLAWILERASQVRQRQSISHVYCIERLLRNEFHLEELVELREALEEIGAKQTILEQLQLGVEENTGIRKYQKGLQMMQEREENFFGKYLDMRPILDILGEEASVKGVTCLFCRKPPVDPVFAFLMCLHEGCGKNLGVGEDIETIQKIMEKAEADGSTYREPGRDSMNAAVHQDDDRNGFFLVSTFLDEVPILPSTKLTAAMAVLLTWRDEAPDDKILIFTQFTGTAKMLGFMLQTLNIGFRYYYGGLAQSQKSQALKALKEDDGIQVLVATLKSGNQSLNLTVANRVIIIDQWWNKTAEQQAFGRVVRIGQEKVTHLVNIKTKEPIDDRIYSLQRKKAKDIDRTLQDDGKPQPQVNELELQKAFLRKKAAMEEKERNKKAKAAKKGAAKASSKKKI